MAGDAARADTAYTRGLSAAPHAETAESYRVARVYARHTAGKSLDAYRNEEPEHKGKTFDQLAWLLHNGERTDDLDRLVALHARNDPQSPAVPLWRARVQYHRGQYAAAAGLLRSERPRILSARRNSYTFYDLLIRCLVRTGDYQAALQEARALAASQADEEEEDGEPSASASPAAKQPEPDPFYLLMIRAAKGDVRGAEAAFEKCAEDEYDADELYEDPEIGPPLKGPAFRALRAKHPPTSPATQPAA
jgi:hypothetical protein